jgi:hypothetical protein
MLRVWLLLAAALQIGDVRAKAEAMRSRLEVMRAGLLQRRELLRGVVADKSLRYQAKHEQLAENSLQVTAGSDWLGSEAALTVMQHSLFGCDVLCTKGEM